MAKNTVQISFIPVGMHPDVAHGFIVGSCMRELGITTAKAKKGLSKKLEAKFHSCVRAKKRLSRQMAKRLKTR